MNTMNKKSEDILKEYPICITAFSIALLLIYIIPNKYLGIQVSKSVIFIFFILSCGYLGIALAIFSSKYYKIKKNNK